MNWTDYVILAVLGLSVLVGLWRGLVSEVMALAIWIIAAWVAWQYGPLLASHLPQSTEMPSAPIIGGYLICFILVLIIGAMLRFMIERVISSTGLGGTDRLLGMVFGLLRGMLLVSVLVFLLDFTAFTRDPWWRQSQLVPQFQSMAAWLGAKVPPDIYQHLNPARLMQHLPSAPMSSASSPAVGLGTSSSSGGSSPTPVAT